MRVILDDAVPGPDSPGLEVHDERERFLEGEAKAGAVLYVGLRGGEAGTVLTECDALSLIWELCAWATRKWGPRAVLATVPEEVLRAELARRHARLLREGLGDPAKLVAERVEDLSREGRAPTVAELFKDLGRFGLTPGEVRRELLAGSARGAWSLADEALTELQETARLELRSVIRSVLGSPLPQGPWTLAALQDHADLEGRTTEEIAAVVTELVKAGEVRPLPTGGLVLSPATRPAETGAVS